MAQGSRVTTTVHPSSRQRPSAAAAARMATSSAWAVGSADSSLRLRPRPRTVPSSPRTTHPTGTSWCPSAALASSSANRIQASSAPGSAVPALNGRVRGQWSSRPGSLPSRQERSPRRECVPLRSPRLRRLPRDTTLDQRIQDRHKPAEHDLQPPEVEGQGAPVPERPERGLQALPVAGEPRDLEQIPAEMAGVPFELVLHPLGADTLAPPDLEPRAGDRRVHRRLVHALRRVPELLDHQGAVAGLDPLGGSVTGVEGPALGQPAEDEVDADHPAAVALRQRVRVPAVAAAGVQDELAGTK